MGTTKQPRRSPLAQRICRKIAEHFAIHGPVIPDFGPSWNVAPQTFQPIVRLNRDKGEREIVLMRWWLIPYSYWAKDPTIGLRTINAKAETITTAPAFREAIRYRRCLVPAGKARLHAREIRLPICRADCIPLACVRPAPSSQVRYSSSTLLTLGGEAGQVFASKKYL